MSFYKDLATEAMESALQSLAENLATVRTGRANPAMLSKVMIDYYGEMTPINQMSQISVVEGTQLVVKLFDPSQLKNVEKAINAANLGFNAQNDGTVIRMNVPALTQETRKILVKDVSKMAEEAKVVVRNARRDVNDQVKKDGDLSEDMVKRELETVQKVTDEFIKKVDEIAKEKSDEILLV